VVQAQIRHDAIQPGVKTAIEPEVLKVAEYPQERFLVHIVSIFGGSQKVHGKAEHTLVIGANELLKGGMIALLSRPDQRRLVNLHARFRAH
jgi:hypothetical protein